MKYGSKPLEHLRIFDYTGQCEDMVWQLICFTEFWAV